VVDDRLYFRCVEDTVFFARDKIGDGDRRRDLVAHHHVEFQYFGPCKRFVDHMRVKDFFRDCFSHGCSFQ
jgi:hypothetical protein